MTMMSTNATLDGDEEQAMNERDPSSAGGAGAAVGSRSAALDAGDGIGTYATVEGIDGAGKSTVVREIGLRSPGALSVREPTSGYLTSSPVRSAITTSTTGPVTDLMLFVADRAHHLETLVGPELSRGTDVISDRSHLSSTAYQVPRLVDELGMGLDEARRWVSSIYSPWNIEPDVVIWIDVPVETSLERSEADEKWHGEGSLRRIRAEYEHIHDEGGARRVDGTLPAPEVADECMSILEDAGWSG